MSEGSAVPYVRRWAMTALQAATGLDGVIVQYSPVLNNDEALSANGGRIEAIYWDRWRTTIGPRAMKGTANIKYREEATADLIITVVARDVDYDYEDVDSRAANLLGEVIKVFQGTQPTSPGSHLPNISTYVSSVESDPGVVSSAGTSVYATALRVEVTIQASVEQ